MIPFLTLVVADVMTTRPMELNPEDSLDTVRRLFHIHEYNAFPVVQGERFVGWLTQFDMLSQFLPEGSVPDYEAILNRSAGEVMSRNADTVATVDPLPRVLRKMIETGHHSFPVVDGVLLVGVIARSDLLKAFGEEVKAR